MAHMDTMVLVQPQTVTSVDWTTYWDPWITILKEQGFKAMATDFYDYAPPVMYLLYGITLLPVNAMTAFKSTLSAKRVRCTESERYR